MIGVYELGWPAPTDTGYATVYLGEGNIKDRLQAHARSDKTWAVYRCIVTNSKRRAKQIERRELIRYREEYGCLPRYNRRIG